VLAPGQRADALVRGEREAGAYRLLDGAAPLATLAYRGRSPTPWQVPGRLVSFTPLAAPGGPRRVFVLRQVMSAAVVLGRGVSFSINGKSYDPERSDTAVRLNGVEEWQYDNPTATDQPMHLHTNAFQVVDAAGQAQPGWKDTVVVKAGASARLRVRFADFAGRTVHHGAVLDRADLGMAAVVEIQA